MGPWEGVKEKRDDTLHRGLCGRTSAHLQDVMEVEWNAAERSDSCHLSLCEAIVVLLTFKTKLRNICAIFWESSKLTLCCTNTSTHSQVRQHRVVPPPPPPTPLHLPSSSTRLFSSSPSSSLWFSPPFSLFESLPVIGDSLLGVSVCMCVLTC